MRTPATFLFAAALLGATAQAQTAVATATTGSDAKPAATAGAAADSAAKPAAATKKESTALAAMVPAIQMQHFRPVDQRGLNRFETSKDPGVAYDGFKLQLGAAFTQQFQGLGHENTAQPRLVNGVNANQLIQFGHGFFFGGLAVRNV